MKYLSWLKIPVLLSIIIAFSSCSNIIYFTQDIREKLEEHKIDMNKVQFYNSNKITLTRAIPLNEAKVANGTVRFEDGQYIDEVIINKLTPGACRMTEFYRLGIAFEQGDARILKFAVDKMTKEYVLDIRREGRNPDQVVYDTLIYNVNTSRDNCKLMIRKDDRYILQISQRVARGQIVR